MTERQREPFLPLVTEDDIETVLFEDLTDPQHYVRWVELMESNPILARVIMSRAQDMLPRAKTDIERIKIAIDLAAYAVRAIEVALERSSNDGVGGDEGPRPSA
jgi:hypothetical protein